MDAVRSGGHHVFPWPGIRTHHGHQSGGGSVIGRQREIWPVAPNHSPTGAVIDREKQVTAHLYGGDTLALEGPDRRHTGNRCRSRCRRDTRQDRLRSRGRLGCSARSVGIEPLDHRGQLGRCVLDGERRSRRGCCGSGRCSRGLVVVDVVDSTASSGAQAVATTARTSRTEIRRCMVDLEMDFRSPSRDRAAP